MVTQGNFVTAKAFGNLKQRLSPVPRAPETGDVFTGLAF
jgi:hypothetical protein